ncbi:MAG: hypothetical protein JO257_06055 [Deltaproteobacteria bacterium]|nr:hypothetical protein [Deltaproteobacteria bacterium]
MPKSKKPRTRLSVQIPAELRAAIDRAAAADHRTPSSWVVHALAAAIASAGGR